MRQAVATDELLRELSLRGGGPGSKIAQQYGAESLTKQTYAARLLDRMFQNPMVRLVYLSELAQLGDAEAEEEFVALSEVLGVAALLPTTAGDEPLVEPDIANEGRLLDSLEAWADAIRPYAEDERNWFQQPPRWPPRRFQFTLRLPGWVTSIKVAYTVDVVAMADMPRQPMRHLRVMVFEEGRISQADIGLLPLQKGFAAFFQQFAELFFPFYTELPFEARAAEPIRREGLGGPEGTDRVSSWRTGIVLRTFVPVGADPEAYAVQARAGTFKGRGLVDHNGHPIASKSS